MPILYWTTVGNRKGAISRANLDGTNPAPLVLNQGPASDVTFNIQGLAGKNPAGSIAMANLDGSSPDVIVGSSTGNVIEPVGITLNREHIFWANADGGFISRANLDGSNSTIIVHAQGTNFIGTVGNRKGSIARANLDGTNPIILVPNQCSVQSGRDRS